MKLFFLRLITILVLPLAALADTVSYEQFFSDDVFKGGVACASLGGDAYLNEPAPAYKKPEASAIFADKKPVKGACVAGGGDCDCYAMFTEKAPAQSRDKSFYKVKTKDDVLVWVLGDKSSERTIEKLATKAGAGEIFFRTPTPVISTTADLKNRITKEQLQEIPPDILKRVREKNTDRYVLASVASIETVDGQQVARIEMNWITNDPESDDWNEAATEKKSRQKFRLREAYIPLYDKAGRINFWLTTPPGC